MIRHAAAAATLAVAIALGGCGGDNPDTVPSFEAVDTATGSAVTPADLRGQPALLAAWATWCVPCERELPALEAAKPDIEAAGVRVVAVNVDAAGVDDADVAAMLDRLAPSLESWRDDTSAILTAYEATFMPFSVLIDADGRVQERWLGSLDPDSAAFRDAIAGVASR